MKGFICFWILALYSCNQAREKRVENQTIVSSQDIIKNIDSLSDEKQIERVLRLLYEWNETKSKLPDFEPLEDKNSELYLGLDLKKNEERVKELRNTMLFSEKFIENYIGIIKSIDLTLKNGGFEWAKGELPPFGTDADPWCNCQDYPDKYWIVLHIRKLKIENNIASFSWAFDNGQEYKIKAIKENNQWKILFMEGLDENTFLNIN
jgi:hypothetical protein